MTGKLSAPEMTVLASKTAWAEPTVACRTTRHNNGRKPTVDWIMRSSLNSVSLKEDVVPKVKLRVL